MYSYKNFKCTIIKKLNIIDKNGEWVQIEMLDGPNKGMRLPVSMEELKQISK